MKKMLNQKRGLYLLEKSQLFFRGVVSIEFCICIVMCGIYNIPKGYILFSILAIVFLILFDRFSLCKR